MQIIAIVCFGERSSYMLSKKLKEYVDDEAIYFGGLKQVLKQYDEISKRYTQTIAYGSISIFNKYEIRKYAIYEKVDVIWLCPQAQYRKKAIFEAFSPHPIDMQVMDNKIFGTYDVQSLWNKIQEHSRKKAYHD